MGVLGERWGFRAGDLEDKIILDIPYILVMWFQIYNMSRNVKELSFGDLDDIGDSWNKHICKNLKVTRL